MKVFKSVPIILLFVFSFFFQSCENSSNTTNISSYGDRESHNMGKNCMDCHKKGGQGEGQFKIAGTVYDSTFTYTVPNATVNLYTQGKGGGQMVKTIEVDGNGNFFTTESMDFGTGLYPSVTGTSGKTVYMVSPVTTGACNSCHNYTNCKIYSL